MESIITCARELGMAIQESAEFQRLQFAREAQEADDDLQEKIQEFNLLRQKLVNEQKKAGNGSSDKVTALEAETDTMYNEIVIIPVMKEFLAAKREMDKIVGDVNRILSYYITGDEGCGGGCDSCGGCGDHNHG